MARRRKLFIIHFLPLELYPPIMNLVDFFANDEEWEVIVVTNKEGNNWLSYSYENPAANIKIYRPAVQSKFAKSRFINYILFYVSCFFLLIRHWPPVIFYFETLSSWPALIYRKIRGKSVALMAHYHEYTSSFEYQTRMLLSKWMHKIELKMYPDFSWISQTNEIRLEKFKNDSGLNGLPPDRFHLLPNYPPRAWQNSREIHTHRMPVRLVYVGSLGYKNMYLQEVLDWVTAHEKIFTLDIYAYNMDAKAREILKAATFSNIRFHGGCKYHELPEILKNYDVGLVIYKPFSENTVHAVSNKVFEYLAAGLDVWFSEDMTYTFGYVKQTFPKILPVNFKDLQNFNYKKALSREGIAYEQSPYNYESVYKTVVEHINNEVSTRK